MLLLNEVVFTYAGRNTNNAASVNLDQREHQDVGRRWQFNLELQTQGIYALLGRSGSGKSTLLNLIGGFSNPDSGDITWHNRSLIGLEPAQRPVTTLFQQYNLFSHLSVWKNVALGVSPKLSLSAEQRGQISELLISVGLSGYDDSLPSQLSGGEQQRVALARCLLRRKPVLLLDEPFSALDSTTRQEMITLLRQLISQYKPCVLMITHDESDALAINANILEMHNEGVFPRQ